MRKKQSFRAFSTLQTPSGACSAGAHKSENFEANSLKILQVRQAPRLRTHFTIGCVGPPFGLKGFVKVKPLSGETGHFSRLEKVTLKHGDKEETWGLAETVFQEGIVLIRFAGIDNPEKAALLNGAEIIAPRENAAPLKEGEYYVEDLKGLEVIDREGKALGHIEAVVEGGGGNLAEIKLGSGEKRLAPFRNEFFGDVSLEKGQIVLLESWVLE
jgi:16S rRNA processing protein RimM